MFNFYINIYALPFCLEKKEPFAANSLYFKAFFISNFLFVLILHAISSQFILVTLISGDKFYFCPFLAYSVNLDLRMGLRQLI